MNSLAKALAVQIVPLTPGDLPDLDPGMTNVTGPKHSGYRFLPHGKNFKNKVKIKIPYDPAEIPAGSVAADIKTYYFDEEHGRYLPLEFSALDETNHVIESLTDHFTDIINATITDHDHPQETSFNPNQIKDITAADPAPETNLIELP